MPGIKWGKLSGASRESKHGAKARHHAEGYGRDSANRRERARFWRSRCMTNPVADVTFSIKAASSKPTKESSPQVLKNLEAELSSLPTGIHDNPVGDLDAAKEQDNRVECKEDAKQLANGNFRAEDEISHIRHTEDANGESGNVWLDAFSGENKVGAYGACNMACTKPVCADSYLERGAVHDKAWEDHSLQSVVHKVAFHSCIDNYTVPAIGDRFWKVNSIPHNVVAEKDNDASVCGMSKMMLYPGVVTSQQFSEHMQIQAWFNEGNTRCPSSQKPSLLCQHEQNLTMKVLEFPWASLPLHASGPYSTNQNSFSSHMTNLSHCPSSMNGSNEIFFSCSSNSISNLVEGKKLHGFSTSLSSLQSKLFVNPDLQSLTSCCTSACSSSSPEHLGDVCLHNHFSTSSSTGSSSYVVQELPSSQEIKVIDDGRNPMQDKTSSRQWDRVIETISLSRKPSEYTLSRIHGLVSDLKSPYIGIQRNAASELRLLAKNDEVNRILIVNAGALKPLLTLLCSGDSSTQLDATTALLNLSLTHSLKEILVNEGAIEYLVGVLRGGLNEMVKANAAAALAYLSVYEAIIRKIGSSGAITPLVDLLERGSLRSRKDAAAALYKLSSLDENKKEMVRSRTLRPLIKFMHEDVDKEAMVDKAMAIVKNLVSIEEGRVALVREGGIMSLLHVIKVGSQRSRGLAVPVLFELCTHDKKHLSLVQQSEPLPTLMSIYKTANSRLKIQIADMIDVLTITSG